MTATFKTNDDQYAALLNLLCALAISIELKPTTEGSSNTHEYTLKLNVPNIKIENSTKEFDCYLVSKVGLYTTPYVDGRSIPQTTDYLIAYKIKNKPVAIGSAESKATKAFSLTLTDSELEDLALKFILNVAAIYLHAYPESPIQLDTPFQTTHYKETWEGAMEDAADGIYSKMSSIFGTSSLFGLYARGRFSGDNFSLPNKLLSQVREGEQQENETDWDEMILGRKHAYVSGSKMLSVLADLSRSDLTAKVKGYAKDNNLNYDSFMTGTRFQTGCADDVVCWMVEE